MVREQEPVGGSEGSSVKVYDIGGDLLQTDILKSAFVGADGVFTLQHCGSFNVMILRPPLTSTFAEHLT